MKAVDEFLMVVNGELQEEMERQMKPYNIKMDLTQAMHIEGFHKKTGASRAEVIRKLVEIGVEETLSRMDEKTRNEMNELFKQAAMERAEEIEKGRAA